MSVVTWHLPSSEIIARLGFSDFRADPGNALRYLIEDVVSGELTATIRFSTGAGGRIVSVAMKDDAGVDLLSATGLSLTRAEFDELAEDVANSADLYHLLVGLIDDDTTVNGSVGGDQIETGAGDDVVSAGAGDDVIRKWAAGDLEVSGGAGTDTLSFQTQTGIVFPNFPAQGAVVNLTTGAGVNPFGGALKITGVENVIGTFLADRFTGSSGRNVIGDGLFDSGADVIDARGGADIVYLSKDSEGAQVAGGSGLDELRFSTEAAAILVSPGVFRVGTCVLDLTDPSANTESLLGTGITGFEIFTATAFVVTQSIFVFRGDAEGQTVTGMDEVAGSFLPSGRDRLFGGGGDDVLNGLSADDLLDGGDGNDVLRAGSGKDTIFGNFGQDVLFGGGGADRFGFRGRTDSSVGAADVIRDFLAGVDEIDLSGIDAITGGADDAFDFIAGAAFSATGQVRVFRLGNQTHVELNFDADLAADAEILLEGRPVLGEADFGL